MRPPIVKTITNAPGRLSFDTARELRRYRAVLFAFAARSIRVRYKQAAIGLGWSIVQPVTAAIVFSVFLGRVAHVGSEGIPYFAFVLCGTSLWSCFSSAVSSASESLVSEQALVRKIYFPREVLPLAAVASACVDLAPSITILGVAATLSGIHPTLMWLLLPVPITLTVLTAAGLGILLSSLNVFYRDVRYVLPFITQIGLFATPVVWSLRQVPSSWAFVYQVFNPMANAIDTARRLVVHQQLPDALPTLLAFGVASVLLVAGSWVFKRLEHGFADRV